MYGNSFFKIVVMIFSGATIVAALYTVIFNKTPMIAFILFFISLILNIIDNAISNKQYKKNMASIDEQMDNMKKSIKSKKNKNKK